MEQEGKPEMLRASLEFVILQIKTLNMGSPRELLCLALDPPPESYIERAVDNLKEVYQKIKNYTLLHFNVK